jgi:FKBP-type peptidyl-prolyl cis-trans isomerase 2
LAGKTLTFDIEIVDIREATLEEIKQGKPQSSANI